ncbi:hypothetical protein ACNKHL_09950 [Shigella flexneri]
MVIADAAIFLFEPEKSPQIVREAVGSSALFADRLRNCAARAGDTRAHSGPSHPLWQQRLRASSCWKSLGYPDFGSFRTLAMPARCL